jgi:thymidylate synthase
MTDFDKAIEEAKAEILPYESWEQLPGETGAAYAAFCAFRDFGLERNIRKAVETSVSSVEKSKAKQDKRYRVWRNWSTQYRWRERAGDYDRYMEKLKQGELRKTIEAQGEKHREVTGKMLDVVCKKLDTMNPEELTQGNVSAWAETAIRAEREAEFMTSRNSSMKQGELSFVSDFEGI